MVSTVIFIILVFVVLFLFFQFGPTLFPSLFNNNFLKTTGSIIGTAGSVVGGVSEGLSGATKDIPVIGGFTSTVVGVPGSLFGSANVRPVELEKVDAPQLYYAEPLQTIHPKTLF
jgi:hypothetical protein